MNKRFLPITILSAFLLVASAATAQTTESGKKALNASPQSKTSKIGSYQIVNVNELNEAELNESSKKEESHAIYYHYNGIVNLEEAKQAWIKDNPDAYKQLLQERGINSPSKEPK